MLTSVEYGGSGDRVGEELGWLSGMERARKIEADGSVS
jgi:hypothetical protein